jgi:hypothetical protein
LRFCARSALTRFLAPERGDLAFPPGEREAAERCGLAAVRRAEPLAAARDEDLPVPRPFPVRAAVRGLPSEGRDAPR